MAKRTPFRPGLEMDPVDQLWLSLRSVLAENFTIRTCGSAYILKCKRTGAMFSIPRPRPGEVVPDEAIIAPLWHHFLYKFPQWVMRW